MTEQWEGENGNTEGDSLLWDLLHCQSGSNHKLSHLQILDLTHFWIEDGVTVAFG